MPRESRKPSLNDRDNRSAVLSALRKGGTVKQAAAGIGSYAKAVHRYARANQAFRLAMDAAIADGERALFASSGGATVTLETAGPIPPSGATMPPENRGGPLPESVEAAEILAMDVDLVSDVDASLPQPAVSDRRELPPMNSLEVLAFHWRVMHSDTEPPVLRKSSSEIVTTYVLGPALAAQARRNAHADRVALAESVIQSDPDVEGEPGDSAGLVILAIPSNGRESPADPPADPAPLESPVIDGEMVDA